MTASSPNENISATVIHNCENVVTTWCLSRNPCGLRPDSHVLMRAADENRLLITHDKDFGVLAFRWRLPVPPA